VYYYNLANKKKAEAIYLNGKYESVIDYIYDSLPNRSSRRRLNALFIYPVFDTKISASVSYNTIDRDNKAI